MSNPYSEFFQRASNWLQGIVYKPGWEMTVTMTDQMEVKLDIYVQVDSVECARPIALQTPQVTCHVRFEANTWRDPKPMAWSCLLTARDLESPEAFLATLLRMIHRMEHEIAQYWEDELIRSLHAHINRRMRAATNMDLRELRGLGKTDE